jgi:hypothetical protein
MFLEFNVIRAAAPVIDSFAKFLRESLLFIVSKFFLPPSPPRGDVNPASLDEVPHGGFRGQLILFIFAL